MVRILVVDDEQPLREEIAGILRFEDFDVVEADNGEVAIYLAHMQLPDLVICDITMPGMDGYELLAKVRSTPEMAQLPFIFVTAHAAQSYVRHGMELGADDYLTKPFTRVELLSAVNVQLNLEGRSSHSDVNDEEPTL